MNLDEFRDLWESPKNRYVLVVVDESAGEGGLVIYDVPGRSVMLVDDDDLHDQIVHCMREAGIAVMDEFPK